MKLDNVRVSINRNSNDEVSIELTDRDSGTRFFRGVLTLEAFARAITAQSELRFTSTDVRGLERLGTLEEVKTELVTIPKGFEPYHCDDFAKAHAEWVKPYEVDGWTADIDARWNGHRGGLGGGTYKTNFRRWVRKETP